MEEIMKKFSSLALTLLLALTSCSPAKDAPSTEPGGSTLSQSVEATTQDATTQEATTPEATKVETTTAKAGAVKIENGKITIFCPEHDKFFIVASGCPITVNSAELHEKIVWSGYGSFIEIEADATGDSDASWKVDRLISARIIDYDEAVDTCDIPELGSGSESAVQIYKSGSDTYILFRDERGYKVFSYDPPFMSAPPFMSTKCEGVIPFHFTQDGILTAEAMERFLYPQKNAGSEVAILATHLTEGLKDASTSAEDISDAFIATYAEFTDKLTDVMLDQSEKGSNFLISPMSVMTNISMVANGAAGETLTQMETALGENFNLEEVNKGLRSWYAYCGKYAPETLGFANSIWLNKDSGIEKQIREDFLRKCINNLDTSIYATPFNAQGLEDVNNWCRSKTLGMIPNILDRFNDEDAIVLLNTLAFDALWALPFDPGATSIREFTNGNGNTEAVDMMFGFGECDLRFSMTDQDLSGVIKSFEDTPFIFAAFLPEQEESAEDLLRRLDAKKLREVVESWKKYGSPGEERVEILMPKFDYSTDYDLSKPLKALGIKDAFDPTLADFSNMTGDRSLFITRALHKTSIELNERGTRIAAGGVLAGGYGEIMCFDRPFVYVIFEEKYGLPVFMGLVNHIN